MYYAFIYISNLFQDKFWTYWPAEILRQHPGLRETTEGALREGGNKDELKPPPGRTLLPECCPKATAGYSTTQKFQKLSSEDVYRTLSFFVRYSMSSSSPQLT